MNRSAAGDGVRSVSWMIANVRPSHGASIGSVASVRSRSSLAISDIGISVTASEAETIVFMTVGESAVIAGSGDGALRRVPFPSRKRIEARTASMLRWTASRPGERLAIIVRHTDAAREWAYDRASKVGRLDRALDEAQSRGWTIVDMARDWATVYAPATQP